MDPQDKEPREPTLGDEEEEIPTTLRVPGDRIVDRYQLVRVLDRGGMGVVWVAHHLTLDVQVALKLLRPNASSRMGAARLVREAQAAARLNHPAILRVLDVGRTTEDEPFLVMELLDGEPLSDVLLRERALDPIAAVRTLLPIADGLAAMHEKGIIHRDLKPENIFLSRGDAARWQPKLIDFGVAKLRESAVEGRITRRGMAIGTPVYMSLEQIQGAEADPRTDVWAFAVVLYEVMSGELPFEAPHIARQITLLLADAPTPLHTMGVGDEALWTIIRRGLSTHAERWPSTHEMGKALARWLWAQGVTTDIAGVSLRARWLDEDDIRRLSQPPISQTQTARFPVPLSVEALRDHHQRDRKPAPAPPPDVPTLKHGTPAPKHAARPAPAAPTPRHVESAPPASHTPAPPMPRTSEEIAIPLARRKPPGRPWLSAAIVAGGVGVAIAIVAVGRAPESASGGAASATTITSAAAAPATASAAPAPEPSASASSPTPEPSASASSSASARPLRPKPPVPRDLKDPFHR